MIVWRGRAGLERLTGGRWRCSQIRRAGSCCSSADFAAVLSGSRISISGLQCNRFMAKKKKYKFSVILYLEGLSSVPFINGLLYAKVRLLDGGSFVHQSPSTEVQDHSVVWDSKFEFTCKMSANASSGVLNSCKLRISVRKEVKGGRSALKLGFVDLDLAEYAGAGLTSSKRFLLEPYSNTHQRSDNSTLKLSLEMSLLHGDPLFKRPSYPLSSRSQFYNDNVSTAVHTPQGSNDAEDERAKFESTRVDPEEVVKELVNKYIPAKPPSVPAELASFDTNEKGHDDDEEEEVGLQLLVSKDGTATLGSRSGTNERKKKQLSKQHHQQHQQQQHQKQQQQQQQQQQHQQQQQQQQQPQPQQKEHISMHQNE